jgi:hypothetical protein
MLRLLPFFAVSLNSFLYACLHFTGSLGGSSCLATGATFADVYGLAAVNAVVFALFPLLLRLAC